MWQISKKLIFFFQLINNENLWKLKGDFSSSIFMTMIRKFFKDQASAEDFLYIHDHLGTVIKTGFIWLITTFLLRF